MTLPAYTPVPRPLWSAAELGIFRAAIVGYWLEPLFTVLLTSGLRIGEALALQWPDVRAGALRVNGTLRYQAGRPVLNPPKSRAGRRTVILPPAGQAALEAQRQQQADWRAKAGKRWPPGAFVFTKRDGRPLTVSTPHAALRRFCAQLNLPPLTPHGLRHLHASLLIQEGVPVTAIAARLGHSSPAITLRVYAHALTGQDEAAAAAIAAALGE